MKINIKIKDIKQWLKGKEGLLGVLGAAPFIAAATVSGSCAAGCPYGLVNDPYPGQCPRYIDADADGICDLSQTAATSETDSDTSNSETDSPTQDTQTTTTNSNGNQDTGADQSTGSDTGAADPNVTNTSNVTSASDHGSFDLGNLFGDGGAGYHVIPVSMLLLGGYLFTHYLFTKGILTPKKHKRIWNLLVTGGYLGTGVTGVLLILMIKLGITALRQPITFWHAELSILMVVGTLIHIHIYRKPFKKMFKVLFGFGSDKNTKNSEKDV
ncbi:hypothetical protein [Methanobacterium aggregans]|uniref:hypothetical protein n=1 Tax=Methanobacterium aggregans TaxID=1615586 RepID=UPI001FDA5D66|nr:hypothetical protein [Methanobacterium aggregans]MBP2045990.1 hypothetical protein [Methanobacterium aggregans]